MITQKELKKLLHYSKKSGLFIWKKTISSRAIKGGIAGTTTDCGYVQIGITNKQYLAHRLAFLYVKGRFPKKEADHKNRIRSDNRWKNLREATHQQNQNNKSRPALSKRSSSGITGVTARGRFWRARIYTDRKEVYLGTFKTKEEAKGARKKAEKQHQTFKDQKETPIMSKL